MLIIHAMDLRGADLALLVSLEALVAERSVTRAARRMGLSQPAMSAQLARLRDLFGDPLLVGNARGMTPTRRAERLAEALKGPLAEIAHITRRRDSFDPARSTATVRLVGSDQVHTAISVPLASRLAKRAPGMRLAVFAFQTGEGAGQFADKHIDLGVVTPSMSVPGMMSEHLFDDDLVIARAKGHASGPGAPSLGIYCAQKHILVSTSGGGFAASVDEALAVLGRRREVAVSVQSFSVAAAMAEETGFYATLPRRYAERLDERLEIAELPVKVAKFSFRMVWPRRLDADGMHIWLREQVRAVVARAD